MERSTLPNSTASLVLGIISIVTCLCYGIIGLPLGIIGLVLAKKAINTHNESPEIYSGIANAKAGMVTSIIGIVFNTIYLGLVIWIFTTIGPEGLQDIIQEIQNS